MKRSDIITRLFSVCFIFIFLAALTAETIKVPRDFATIQFAINSAKSGDVIMVVPGKFSPSTNGEIFPILMKSNCSVIGSGAKKTIIDAEFTERVFVFDNVENVSLEDLTVKGGFLSEFSKTSQGGGILIHKSNPTLSNLIITENEAWLGGGIGIINSIPTFINITVKNNKAFGAGGGVSIAYKGKINGDFINLNNKVGLNANLEFNSEGIALVTKSRGRIDHKKNQSFLTKPILPLGTHLSENDFIKTYDDGFAIFIYKDDKTMIKIHNDSELIVSTTNNKKNESKKILMDSGSFFANVNKQQNGEFKIITPTSVASVKGTEFWVNTDLPGKTDEIICLDGAIEIQNKTSYRTVTLTKNKTAISTKLGHLDIIPTEIKKIPQIKIMKLDKIQIKQISEFTEDDIKFKKIVRVCLYSGLSLAASSLIALNVL